MSYAVFVDPDNRTEKGEDRWAGYGVPAECDWPGCHTRIDRGTAYKCEDHGDYELQADGRRIDYDQWDDFPEAKEVWVESEGCNLFFCGDHESNTEGHDTLFFGKPDSAEWEQHMLTDESWQQWRDENPEKTAQMKERHTDAR